MTPAQARFGRRRFLLGAASALALGGCAFGGTRPAHAGPIAALLPGRIDDGGFIQAGYEGLLRVRDKLGVPIDYRDRVPPEREAMLEAFRELARSDATMVIGLGGQTSEAIQRVAWEFPEQRFTLIQGNLLRPNLAVYEVLQEQSTFLAGAAAGLLTKSNVVGHMSGLRVRPGLKARAAFAAGLAATNPGAKLLTNFSGTQDDAAIAKRIALAQIDAGVDILFTMLNAGRAGAIEACRERRVPQIGNARDWVAAMPEVFIGSAFADVGVAVFECANDLFDNVWTGDRVRTFGLARSDAIRLVLRADVPPAVTSRVDRLRREIVAGGIKVPDEWSGTEFEPR